MNERATPGLQEVIESYLKGRGLGVQVVSDATYALEVQGEHGRWQSYITAREPEAQVLVHAVLPQPVPFDRRVEVALYLTRANYGLVIGNFELDLDDGEVRFKTSIDVEGATLTEALVDHLVIAGAVTTDRYIPGLQAVIDGMSARDAVVAVERELDEEP
jgi:hypothetical protein